MVPDSQTRPREGLQNSLAHGHPVQLLVCVGWLLLVAVIVIVIGMRDLLNTGNTIRIVTL